jgi:hypothetical protein
MQAAVRPLGGVLTQVFSVMGDGISMPYLADMAKILSASDRS